MKKPVVFDYMDARSFLQDYYTYRKNSDDRFSYEIWASELNYSSRSYLRMVLIGKKRISDGFIEAFCRSSKLDQQESDYLEILVKHSQAATQNAKQAFNQKLFQILRNQIGQSEITDYAEFVETPFLPRLLTLLSFQDIRPTSETFARLMNSPVKEIQQGLEKLTSLGLAEPKSVAGEIHWSSLNRRFKVPDKIGHQAMINFHKRSLTEAAHAIATTKENRKYKSLLLPLNKSELEQVYALLDSFSSEQIARFNSDNYQTRRLYQLNLNIHAIAEEYESLPFFSK